MRRVRLVGLSALLVAVVLASGFMAAAMLVDGDAKAQEAKSGPWRSIMPMYVCDDTCGLRNVSPDALKDMTKLDELALPGDPNGSPAVAINVIAKLERDHCEWQWQTVQTQVVILFRC
jgi:hypothetical protein